MTFMEGFAKYIGVQGIMALALVGGYIAAPYVGVVLPEGYTEITTFVCGFYFAKNGVPIVASRLNRS